jgi:hypothetical protein
LKKRFEYHFLLLRSGSNPIPKCILMVSSIMGKGTDVAALKFQGWMTAAA